MLKRRYFYAIWFLLLAFVSAQAQPAAAPQPQPRRFLMWKASSPTTTVYLFGSIHVADNSMYPLPKEVESAFTAARVLAVEINLKNVEQGQSVALMQKYGMYPQGDSLSQHLSKETSVALADFCAKHNVPTTGMEQLKPWMIAISIAAMSFQQAGEDPQLGIDMHFLNESAPPQRIDEFESVESQLSMIATASDQEQQGMLLSTLKESGRIKDLLRALQAAYTSGDPNALQKLLDEESDMGSASLTKKLLDDRNITMTAKIDQYLKAKDPVFVVVGAAHLVGEKGIAKLLRDKGYKVEQLTLEAK